MCSAARQPAELPLLGAPTVALSGRLSLERLSGGEANREAEVGAAGRGGEAKRPHFEGAGDKYTK